MARLIVDSGAASRLAARYRTQGAISRFRDSHASRPLVVPSVVLVECLQGKPHTDVVVNRLLKSCELRELLPEKVARRAALLRARAGTGSAVDAIVVAIAEPDGIVVTTDLKDCRALAAHARNVEVLAA